MVRIKLQHKDAQHDLEIDLDDGREVLQLQLYSLTSVLPDDQIILGLSEQPLTIASEEDLTGLRVLDGQTVTLLDGPKVPSCSTRQLLDEDEALARQLQAEEEAALAASTLMWTGGWELRAFRGRLESSLKTVLLYEDKALQAKARALVPMQQLEEAAAVQLALSGEEEQGLLVLHDATLRQLLRWFKGWFSWVDSPACHVCGGATGFSRGGQPTPEDLRWGGSRVELHQCRTCGVTTRFVRYNDPSKLLDTRQGRCGEWANCFTLICRALGFDARKVDDWTDHVWTECYSHHLQRWVHLDPCEAAFDQPLLYEKGWGKELSWIFAVGRYGVYDVTRRYTADWEQVATRRVSVPEHDLQLLTASLTRQLQRSLSDAAIMDLARREGSTQEPQLENGASSATQNLAGRQTGSLEWRAARGETGAAFPAEKASKVTEAAACDRHVAPILHQLGILCAPAAQSGGKVQVHLLAHLRSLQTLVKALQAKPYKERSLNLSSPAAPSAWLPAVQGSPGGTNAPPIPSALPLLVALGLRLQKREQELWLVLDDRPNSAVQVAVALRVLDCQLAHVLREIQDQRWGKGSFLRSIIEGERLAGGRVAASKENLPSELATAAFDCCNSSKWLCCNMPSGDMWISYTVPMAAEVSAYVITSADDCPERDPKAWVLEGRLDPSDTWHSLDVRQQETFRDRHLSRVFEVAAVNRRKCSSLRLRVTATAGSPDLQISAIDFFQPHKAPAPLSAPPAASNSSPSPALIPSLLNPPLRGGKGPLQSAEQAKSSLAELVKSEFEKLMKDGQLTPNAAAKEALRRVHQKMVPAGPGGSS